jgi:hypothetical protein
MGVMLLLLVGDFSTRFSIVGKYVVDQHEESHTHNPFGGELAAFIRSYTITERLLLSGWVIEDAPQGSALMPGMPRPLTQVEICELNNFREDALEFFTNPKFGNWPKTRVDEFKKNVEDEWYKNTASTLLPAISIYEDNQDRFLPSFD